MLTGLTLLITNFKEALQVVAQTCLATNFSVEKRDKFDSRRTIGGKVQ